MQINFHSLLLSYLPRVPIYLAVCVTHVLNNMYVLHVLFVKTYNKIAFWNIHQYIN